MKIVVTGGAGFIGSAVIRKAVNDGHQVMNVDCLTYAANLESLNIVKDNANYNFANVNICDPILVENVLTTFKPDAIMHLAAESHVDRSIDGRVHSSKPILWARIRCYKPHGNYRDTLSPQKAEAFRFHHISTDEVYGDLSESDPAFEETTSYDPSSPYSASKAASDHLVRAWARTYGLPILITNCSNNYGPYQFPEKLIPVVILKALHKEPIPVYGKGENIRDWLYVDDHADALLTVLQKGKPGQTYNIGGNNERTNLELVHTLCRLMDEKMQDGFDRASLIEFVTDRPGHDRRYAINANKIETELGWSPSIAFDDGFASTLNWYLENEWWWMPLLKEGQFGQRVGLKAQ